MRKLVGFRFVLLKRQTTVLLTATMRLVSKDYCPRYEEKNRTQSSKGDYDAFVELDLDTIGRAVFGTII
jgi:hypothetical protein